MKGSIAVYLIYYLYCTVCWIGKQIRNAFYCFIQWISG